jgi:putative Mn2+ efflux pump MntP
LLVAPLILSLSLDTFAVSAAIGIAPLPANRKLRFAASCAVAEAAMPLIGLAVGALAGQLGDVADWLPVGLLLGAGSWILRESFEEGDEITGALARARDGGLALVMVALSVSVDEWAIGAAIGTLRMPVAPVLLAIAIQALLASLLGLRLGAALGERVGARATMIAGAVLCLAGLWLAGSNIAGR